MQNRIKERIKELNIKQTELAEKLGITTVGLNQLINSAKKIETYERIAEAMGVPAYNLLLTDDELMALRSNADRPTDEFKCPKCGASLKVVPIDEE